MPTSRLLALSAYREALNLDRRFQPAAAPASSQAWDDLVRELLSLLTTDSSVARLGVSAEQVRAAVETGRGRALLRALLTLREPGPLPAAAVPLLDALLSGERAQRPTVEINSLPTVAEQHPETGYPAAATTAVWRGDITALHADAIVNPANSGLLGCFQPAHRCVDNVIHAAAGPRLREDCHTLLSAQSGPEPTGTAKITRGYHLPAGYVLHTVGPIVNGTVRPAHAAALASSYRSCLDLAAEIAGIRTVAFCSISTGLFGYPKPLAARVALATVADWLNAHPGRLHRVVFDVYDHDDLHIYQQALSAGERPS
ncbi:O-acetyl-ADP-ribose deacetylase [Frankia sp. AiPs1]|uniref:protein-ADP-ribose hydrolase n=1 Tax=Frankia sp. AiPa1 TaxID=573492 RepID=UPI00202ACBCB|nr:protein-ADP-ribose hydrolase [Frankia sp. AiPa1]MCL9763012.1 protein-ADP-ribose hydrolase [Frankia sp. AiPa1]